MKKRLKICIIGLGYVGLPLLETMVKHFDCIGLDCNSSVLQEISLNSKSVLKDKLTSNWNDVRKCNVFIVCVPTPIDESYIPDISSLKSVCESLATNLKKGDIVVFESTVYPGATEELCIPILEKSSNLKLNDDFHVGYSPERINVGDKSHQFINTPKIVSASDAQALETIYYIYSTAIEANIIKASGIKVAEAAKMYENVQRDVLIALANEYADYCRAEGISINEVTRCASTKWNFSNVNPGMVGGHCIGVDPYYLLHRASSLNVNTPLIHKARSINEGVLQKVFERVKNEINSLNKSSQEISILIMGLSYKPNTPDIRNSKALELTKLLIGDFLDVTVFDPLVSSYQVNKFHKIDVVKSAKELRTEYDVVIRLVNHKHFAKIGITAIKYLSVEDLL